MRSFGIFVSVITILSFVACVTVDGSGRSALNFVGDVEANKIGEQAYKEILSKERVSNNRRINSLVMNVSQRIAAASGANFQWEFKVLESEQKNAFCLPGGKIAVYTGILEPAQNTAGLAAVIGHEVAHAVARHSAERMSHAMITNVGIGLVGAFFESPQSRAVLMGALGLGANLGIMMPFSRKHEREADSLGLIYMAKAGYDPMEASKLWIRMRAQGGSSVPEILSTHPSSLSRSKDLAKLARSPKIQNYYSNSNRQLTKAL